MSLPTNVTPTNRDETQHADDHNKLHAFYNAVWGDYATTATLYVNSTGSDANDGLGSGTPFLTLGKAISVLPRDFNNAVTINVDGSSAKTYAEAIDIRSLRNTRSRMLTIAGNTTTPNNVKFTGTVTAIRDDDWSGSTVCYIEGQNLWVTLQGLRCSAPSGGEQQYAFRAGAYVKVDRCNGDTVSGTCNDGLTVADKATVEFKGNCTFSNWTRWGVDIGHTSKGRFTSAGTLTITGPGGGSTNAIGMHVFEHSAFITYTASTHITITGTQYAVQCGLNSEFQHQGATTNLSWTNTVTPSNSAVAQCTDHSTFSTQGNLTADHFTNRFHVNSISYAEHSTYGGAAQGRTITNTGSDNGSQQSAILIDSTNTNYPV